MIDAIKLIEAVAAAVGEMNGVEMSFPAFALLLLIATFLITRTAQRL